MGIEPMNLSITNRLLYQLSYCGIFAAIYWLILVAVSSAIQMMNNRLLIKADTVAYFIPILIKNQ